MSRHVAMSCVFLNFLSFGLLSSISTQAAEDLLAPGTQVEKIAGGFAFTEGPADDGKGNVYFTDINNNRIHKWSPDGGVTVFRENSGAANGLFFDKAGNLLVCEGGTRRVTRIAMDGTVTVLASEYQGKKLNSPNDLWIDPQGGIYFSDPRYGSKQGLEQDGFHVYYITPKDQRLVRVTSDLVMPNGIIGTADGKRLYIADAGDRKIYVYDTQPDGTLANRKLIAPQGSDGMALDEKGNLYLTSGSVVVYSPQGEKLTTIAVPESPANVTFGGKDKRTLFITARTGFYRLQMNVRGQ